MSHLQILPHFGMPLSSVAMVKGQELGLTRMRSEKWLMKFE